jgi:hypothetical protein
MLTDVLYTVDAFTVIPVAADTADVVLLAINFSPRELESKPNPMDSAMDIVVEGSPLRVSVFAIPMKNLPPTDGVAWKAHVATAKFLPAQLLTVELSSMFASVLTDAAIMLFPRPVGSVIRVEDQMPFLTS